ncbi:ABC transporter permease [Rhodoferax sp.]|uniref:ABC transporter permease n=1 Tax=Rhodoferax sp. TaxID=50421 RepID=UPI00374DB598
MMFSLKSKRLNYCLLLCALAGQPAFAQVIGSECGPLTNGFGPFDYRTERSNLNIVEMAHFTPEVEALIKGNAGYLGGDLDYTLRAFPNHHRALMSVMRYGEKSKSAIPRDLRYSVECYFDRAIRFRPDDAISRMIYAMYLNKHGRNPEALRQLDIAAEGAEGKENAFTHYNLGLNYLDMKEYSKALNQAHKAYALGFIQPALKDKLKEAGKWTEPEAVAAEAGASPDEPAK